MAAIHEIFNQSGAGFVFLRAGIKFPPIEEGWQKPGNGHTFQQATTHNGNVGLLAGNGRVGLDQDDPKAFSGLEIPSSTTTWETRPGRLGLSLTCPDRTPEVLAKYGFKADQSQIYLYDPKQIDGQDEKGREIYKRVGEVKLERAYQVIPPSFKFIDPVTGNDVKPGEGGNRVDYKLLNSSPPAEIPLDRLLSDLLKIGLSFKEKGESKAKQRLEQNVQKLEKDKADKSKIRYAEKVLESTIGEISTAKEGRRNKTLNNNAYLLGGYIANGYLDECRVKNELISAAKSCGFDDIDYILGVIESAIPAGKAKPITIPDVCNPSLKPCQGGYGEDLAAIMGPGLAGGAPIDQGITEDEFQKLYGAPCGPGFEVKLPKDHFIMRFMAYGRDVSDGYPEFWFMGGMCALAIVNDKKLFCKLRQMTIYCNLYLAMLGKSTIARKSTISDKTEDLLMAVWPFLINVKVPTEFSPEAFIEHMNDYPHCPWIRDEAAGILNLMRRDYMRGFKETLMTFYDCRAVHRKLRTTQRKKSETDFNVDDPYLNVLFATTPASFAANTELNDTLSGFLARFLYALPQRPKDRYLPLEKGNELTSDLETVVKDQLQRIANKCSGIENRIDMDMTPESKTFFDRWQQEREQACDKANDEFGAQIFGRLAPTVLKFCMLFEMGSPDFDFAKPAPIRLEFMIESCRLMDEYFTITAKAVYDMVGADIEKNAIIKIKAFLSRQGGSSTAREILRYMKIKQADCMDFLETMEASGEVSKVLIKHKSGPPTQKIALNRDSVSPVSIVPTVASVPCVPKTQNVCEESLGDERDVCDIIDTRDSSESIAANPDERLCAKCHRHMGMSAVLPGLGEICLDCLEAST